MNGGAEMDVREKQSSENRLIDYYYLAEKIECPGEPLVYWYDIEAAPTVDAVPVVRCRECKNLNVVNRKGLYAHCPKTNTVFLPFELDAREHFCSLGERKEGMTDGC